MVDISEETLLRFIWQGTVNIINRCIIHDISNCTTNVLAISELCCANLKNDRTDKKWDIIKGSALAERNLLLMSAKLAEMCKTQENYIDLCWLINELIPIFKVLLSKNTKIVFNCEEKEIVLKTKVSLLLQCIIQIVCCINDIFEDIKFNKLVITTKNYDNKVYTVKFDFFTQCNELSEKFEELLANCQSIDTKENLTRFLPILAKSLSGTITKNFDKNCLSMLLSII